MESRHAGRSPGLGAIDRPSPGGTTEVPAGVRAGVPGKPGVPDAPGFGGLRWKPAFGLPGWMPAHRGSGAKSHSRG